MPTPHFYAFRLRKDATTYYKIVNGQLQTAGPPFRPEIANPDYDISGPDGWREEGIKYNRNPTYRGVLRAFSDSLVFVENGAEIVRQVLLNEGTEGLLQLEVLIRNDSEWLYEPFFVGDVDLSSAIASFGSENYGIVCKLKEGGATTTLLSNDNVPFELTLPAGYGNYVLFDGITLLGSDTYLVIAHPSDITGIGQGMLAPFITHSITEGQYTVASVGQSNGRNVGGYTNTDFSGATNPQAVYDEYIFEALIPMQIKIEVNQPNLYYENIATGAVQVIRFRIEAIVAPSNADPLTDTPLPFSQRSIIFEDANLNEGANRTISVQATSSALNLNAGDRVYIVYYFYLVSGDGAASYKFHFPEGNIKIASRFKLPSTIAPYYRYVDAYAQIWNMAGKGKYPFKSDFLNSSTVYVDSKPYNCVITCGNALRQLGTTAKPVKMALRIGDLHKDSSHRWCLGAGIEDDTLRVESLSYFYQDIEIADLGEVANFTYQPDSENLFNQLFVGMQTQNYDGLNGKDEFNTSHTLKLPFDHTPGDADWRSPYRYDMYGIEKERSELKDKNTTDNQADKDIFLADIIDATVPYVKTITSFGVSQQITVQANKLNRPNNSTNTSGIIDPAGAYNIAFSPARDEERMLPDLASRTYPHATGAITFQTSDKNDDLVSNLEYGTIVEKADKPFPLNAPLLYKPVIFRFTGVVPSDFHKKMAANPYGYLSLTFKGVPYKCHVNKAGIADAERLTFDFEGIAHKDTDLATLPSYV